MKRLDAGKIESVFKTFQQATLNLVSNPHEAAAYGFPQCSAWNARSISYIIIALIVFTKD